MRAGRDRSCGPGAGDAAPSSPTKTLKAVPNFTTVTDQAMRAPRPSDWLMDRGNYQGWGYSPLEQINKTNVKTLQLAWSRAMGPGPNQATPIVYDGIMYLASPSDLIQALDARTGDLLWEYKHPLPPEEMFQNDQGQKKRSLVLYGNRVFFVTWDNMVVSLDARTGEQVWQTDRGGTFFTTNSSGPIVANGVVVAGSTTNNYGGGYVTGHDAETGRELWRNELIPRPGQPGDETWAGSPYESRWHTGVWGFITYDPELDLVFYGSSGVSPASEAERKMPGATMAGTDTRFAVRPKTGEIVWRHQVLPRDNWDQECTFEMMVINTPVNPDARADGMLSVNPDARRGTRKTLTGVPCKTGIAWSFDAANGEFLWAKSTTEQNIVARIDGTRRRHGERGRRPQGARQDLRDLSHLCRRPRLADGRLQSEVQCHVHAAEQHVHQLDVAHRSRSAAAVLRLQHQQCRPVLDRQGQGRPHRCDLGRNRPHRVELGNARIELLLAAHDRERASVQRLDGPLPARVRCRQRPGHLGDAASFANRRRARDLFGQWPPIRRHCGRRRQSRWDASRS